LDSFEGKTAVITGAASGIGRALAQRAGAEGMRLVLADIEPEPLEQVAAELVAGGVEVVARVTDVSDGDQVDQLGRVAVEAFGAVHLVCNNAGVGGGGLMESLTEADWQWVLGVNLWGVIHGMRVFLPMLTAQGEGHVVNTASVAGLFAAPFMGPYNASKAAVVAITETAFHELRMAASPVGVSVLCPSWVRTRIHEAARNRPEGLRNPPDPGPAGPGAVEAGPGEVPSGVAEIIGGLVAGGLPPEEVADQVFAGVVAGRLWLLTHPSSTEVVRARMEAIVAGGEPPLLMPR
jgi:NAD(P)-dependent dehydrogenase (short-subunit alcohol dehydrogenase family)